MELSQVMGETPTPSSHPHGTAKQTTDLGDLGILHIPHTVDGCEILHHLGWLKLTPYLVGG